MRLLVLGGTWFLGRTLARSALSRGWRVTAFTRGRSGDPAAGVEHVRGDRRNADDLSRLVAYGPWDATIDTSAYEPQDVVKVLDAVDAGAGRYVLVSTVSAYREWPGSPVSETSTLWPSRLDASESDPDIAAMPEAFQYGTLKAGCELAAATAPNGSLVIRPGVILGPGEYVGRMLSLLRRAKQGGRWLLPAPQNQPIQPIDVRDAADFVLDRIAAGDSNVYNLTAPPGSATYGDLISSCIRVTGSQAEPVWADPEWLVANEVRQWTEMPLWRLASGTWNVGSKRATDAGLVCRPLTQTVADTWTDFQAHSPVPHPRQAEHGMDSGKEDELLRRWDSEMTLRRG